MAAIAVLLPTEISFSCWAGWIMMVLGTGVYFFAFGENIGVTETGYLQAGMFVAMAAMIIYIGRKEYWAILRHAFTRRRAADPLLRGAVVACRVFVMSAAALMGMLAYAGWTGLWRCCWLLRFVCSRC